MILVRRCRTFGAGNCPSKTRIKVIERKVEELGGSMHEQFQQTERRA